MASVTLAIDEEFKKDLQHFSWVNWSEIAKEETKKKVIFEKYLATKKISETDWLFCESIDWHPVDELPVTKEFAAAVKKVKKGKFHKHKSIASILQQI